MNDEDRKILEAVKGRLKEGTEGSKRLKAFREQLEDRAATMLTAREYARELGRIAEEVMSEFAADFVAAEDGYDAVMGALEAVSGPVSGFAAEVQQSINEREKVRIRGIEAPFNRNKASGIAHNVSNAETEEIAQKAINGPVRTFTESAVNDTIEANAGFLQEAGMESIVTRNGGAKCCAWCEKREGSFVYGKQPGDFFQQHENCTCTITFRSEKSTRSWNGSKNRRQIRLPEREETRLQREGLQQSIAYEGVPKDWEQIKIKTSEVDMAAINPNYKHFVSVDAGKEEYGYRYNCVNCVIAYEMRARGWDVTAQPYTKCDLRKKAKSAWVNLQSKTIKEADGSTLLKELQNAEGKRFFIGLNEETGHAFVAEKRKNSIIFLDPQSNSEYNEVALERIISGKTVEFWRMDGIEFSQTGYNACTRVKK